MNIQALRIWAVPCDAALRGFILDRAPRELLAAISPATECYCGTRAGIPNCENKAFAAGRFSRAVLDFAPGMV